jgi:hypothetical protein
MTGTRLAIATTILVSGAVLLVGCGRLTVSGTLVIHSGFGAPSQPLYGSTVAAISSSGRVVEQVRTAPDGSFTLTLEKGFYTVELLPLVGGVGPEERVVVGVGRYVPGRDRSVHLLLVSP